MPTKIMFKLATGLKKYQMEGAICMKNLTKHRTT